MVFEEAQRTAAPLVDALGRVGFKAAELAPEALDSGQDTGREILSRLAVAGFAAANIMLLSVSVWSGSTETSDPSRPVPLALRRDRLAGGRLCRPALLQLGLASAEARRLNMDVPISLPSSCRRP